MRDSFVELARGDGLRGPFVDERRLATELRAMRVATIQCHAESITALRRLMLVVAFSGKRNDFPPL